MRTLAHLSDLHFGRVDPALLAPLALAVKQARPDVVVVSGDFTQRARNAQFEAAAEWIRGLPHPQILVPGNHDIPLYDVARRFLSPLARFRRHVQDDPFPWYADDEIAVIGINTARSLTFKGGRINREQVDEVARRFRGLPDAITRVVVSHHPFDLPESAEDRDLVGRASMAMEAFAGCGVDLFLSGHLHLSHAASTAARYAIDGFAALVFQAGTASSTRGRGEANAFNLVHVGATDMSLETMAWSPAEAAFTTAARQSFDYLGGRGWALKRLDT
jgi:3',5'-cyclic AMP phosphodiesterase CpdA